MLCRGCRMSRTTRGEETAVSKDSNFPVPHDLPVESLASVGGSGRPAQPTGYGRILLESMEACSEGLCLRYPRLLAVEGGGAAVLKW